MSVREIWLHLTDGRAVLDGEPERNDPSGRREAERRCFQALARSDVAWVETKIVARYAGGRKGTYR